MYVLTDTIYSYTEQSRRCPLCSQNIGEYVIHQIRSKYDYQKHYLTPLRTSPKPRDATATARQIARRRAEIRREREWGRRQHREQEEADELERAIEKRRWVYRHHLYAKVSARYKDRCHSFFFVLVTAGQFQVITPSFPCIVPEIAMFFEATPFPCDFLSDVHVLFTSMCFEHNAVLRTAVYPNIFVIYGTLDDRFYLPSEPALLFQQFSFPVP